MLWYALLTFVAGVVVGGVAVSFWAYWDQSDEDWSSQQ